METSATLPQDEADKSSLCHDDTPKCSICSLDKLKELSDVVQQKSDMSISPSLKSRLQEQKITSRGTAMVTHDKQHPSKKPTWPVIFATQGAVSEDGAKVAHKDLQHKTYTLDGLIHESKIGAKDVTPFVCFMCMLEHEINSLCRLHPFSWTRML
jgi:hypothetical protein